MEWLGPLFISILILSAIVQLVWAHSLSVIARKTDQGSMMEVLAWIPLAQIAPMLAVGGGSIGRFLLGCLALLVGNVAVFAAAAFLGEGLGGVLGTAGTVLTMLIAFGYLGRIMWNTATARDLPGWVGLLMFVPVANFFVYPVIAFHDGWAGPHLVGMMLGVLITCASMLPYVQIAKMIGDPEQLPTTLEAWAESVEFQDIGAQGRTPVEIVIADPETPGGAPAPMPTEIGFDHEKSLRALFDLKTRIETLDHLTSPENLRIERNRSRALALVQAIRVELQQKRTELDPEIYDEFANHLDRVEREVDSRSAVRPRHDMASVARDHALPESAKGAGPAAMDPSTRAASAPSRPFAVRVADDCPTGTELRTREVEHGQAGEEEWCQQLDQYGGLRHGWYARYFAGGKPEQVGRYEDGLKVGVWTRFYPSGEIRAQAEFSAGLQHGWLLAFDESGERTKAIHFDRGAVTR